MQYLLSILWAMVQGIGVVVLAIGGTLYVVSRFTEDEAIIVVAVVLAMLVLVAVT